MINFSDDIYFSLYNNIYQSNICKLDNNYNTLKNLSITNKHLYHLFSIFISDKLFDCNIINFNNQEFCKLHNPLEYKISTYLLNLRKNNMLRKELCNQYTDNILQQFNSEFIKTHSYHLDVKDNTESNKIKLKNFFEQIVVGTEFKFNHQCCNGKGVMFDTIDN